MTPTEKALLPCPFCGGKVKIRYEGSSDWEVVCEACPVETSFWVDATRHGYGKGEAEEARRRWNTRAALPSQPAQGWKLVPVEPTPEMLKAGYPPDSEEAQSWGLAEVYRAMLAAAPAAPTNGEAE